MPKYRLYIDEVGNADMKASDDPNHRYLNLTGIIIELGYVRDILYPEIEQIKQRFFGSHPDDPIIFHRRELVRRQPPFHALRNQATHNAFDKDFLQHLTTWQYHVVSVTIDKLAYQQHNNTLEHSPYLYCLNQLIERYVVFLEGVNVQGDVMAESRGSKEDRQLKASFTSAFENGTTAVQSERFQTVLTSKQIKMKKKTENIAGLQLADLIAHPSHKAILASIQKQPQRTDFGGQIVSILDQTKYLRNPQNDDLMGWGKIWLP